MNLLIFTVNFQSKMFIYFLHFSKLPRHNSEMYFRNFLISYGYKFNHKSELLATLAV